MYKIYKKIITRILIYIMCLYLILPIVITADNNPPGFLEDYHGGDPLTNFIDPWRLRMHGMTDEPADMYGWYNLTFFTIAEWEREICLADLSTDVRNIRNSVTNSIIDENNIYMTTVTVAATVQDSFNGSKLYEVSWYILPYNTDALYRVYLKKGNDKEYFEGKKGDDDDDWTDVSQYSGDSDYDARYIKKDYDTVVLEYREGGSSTVTEISVSVVEKTIG